MSSTIGPGFSLIERVLHPTDFSESSLVAFHHALKASMLGKSKLTLLHVSGEDSADWSDFPGIRETLERWGVLPKGSDISAVAGLGIKADKLKTRGGEPADAVIDYLEKHPTDLVVLATRPRDGRIPWLGKSVAAPVARKSREMTLVIPGEVKGFVSSEDGAVSLKNVLIPIAPTPSPEPALRTAARFVQKLSNAEGTFTVLHVGKSDTMPAVRCPEVPGWTWKNELRSGEVIEGILKVAKDTSADLIVMATDGRNSIFDALRGSHSERLLRYSAAPLLTVPVGSRISRHLT
jgi:nucleotide-binding universal stress UspA family protein